MRESIPHQEPLLILRQLIIEAIQQQRLDTQRAARTLSVLDDSIVLIDGSPKLLEGAATFLELLEPGSEVMDRYVEELRGKQADAMRRDAEAFNSFSSQQ